MHLGKPTISSDFKAELKTYYNNPLRKQKYDLPDLFAKQRMSSNKWKSKLLSYILRFQTNSWKISQQGNQYISRSLTPPIHSKKNLKIKAQIKFSETEHSLKLIQDQLKSKSLLLKKDKEVEEKNTHIPFMHKQRKYKVYDPIKICETSRIMRTSISNKERTKSTEKSLNIIRACQNFLIENKEEKDQICSFIEKVQEEKKKNLLKQKKYDESLYKEFVDINSEAVKKEENENMFQRQQSDEKLVNWMKGEERMNKLEFMKYDVEVNGIKTYKRKHNLKKVAIEIRKLN